MVGRDGASVSRDRFDGRPKVDSASAPPDRYLRRQIYKRSRSISISSASTVNVIASSIFARTWSLNSTLQRLLVCDFEHWFSLSNSVSYFRVSVQGFTPIPPGPNPNRETRKLNTSRSCVRQLLAAMTIVGSRSSHPMALASPGLPSAVSWFGPKWRFLSRPDFPTDATGRAAVKDGPRSSRGHRLWRRAASLRAGPARHQAGTGRAASVSGVGHGR